MTHAPVVVVVPTHAHPLTLPYSIRSVSRQTITDIDILIVGDGVGDDTRDVVTELMSGDDRIRFVDAPKSGRTGEPTRHRVLSEVNSGIVAYHGDDDLMFDDHLATMLALLEDRDFVHTLPIFVDSSGGLMYGHFDASKSWWRGSVGPPISRNVISLTGSVHTMESYRRLPRGWHTTPPGIKTDHYMWQQFFALPGIRAATSTKATTVKLHSPMRVGASDAARSEEIARWFSQVSDPGFRREWDQRVAIALKRSRTRGAAMAALALAVRPSGPQWWLDLQMRMLNRGRASAPALRTIRR